MEINDQTAEGQSNPEYATVIMELCGIKEDWTRGPLIDPIIPGDYQWISSQVELRSKLEQLCALIKQRTAINVRANMDLAGLGDPAEKVRKFLDRDRDEDAD